MKILTREQSLQLTGIASATLDNRTRWGQTAFAFGDAPAGHGLYTPLDVLLARTLDVLTPQLGGRRSAADILRIQKVWWIEAVERAEWSRPRIECCFGIVIDRPNWPWQNDDFSHEALFGTLIEIGAALGRKLPVAGRTLALVNLSTLLKDVREI